MPRHGTRRAYHAEDPSYHSPPHNRCSVRALPCASARLELWLCSPSKQPQRLIGEVWERENREGSDLRRRMGVRAVARPGPRGPPHAGIRGPAPDAVVVPMTAGAAPVGAFFAVAAVAGEEEDGPWPLDREWRVTIRYGCRFVQIGYEPLIS